MTIEPIRHVSWWRRWGVPAWPAITVVMALAVVTLWAVPSHPRAAPLPPIHHGDTLASAAPSRARLLFEAGLDSLAPMLDRLDQALSAGSTDSRRTAFREARAGYKRIESLVTVYSPPTAALLNGPLPEENEDRPAGPLGAPAGFQIVEAALFTGESPGTDSVHRTVAGMAAAVRQFRGLTRYLAVTDAAVLDATRLEIARVETLGLAGFDSDPSGDAIVESAAALRGTADLVRLGLNGAAPAAALDSVSNYLARHASFIDLDRLVAIASYLEPAAHAIHLARVGLPDKVASLHHLWRTTRGSVFEAGALEPGAFAPTFAPTPTADLIGLGQRLFFEPRLSGPGTRSCAFCHQPAHAFSDSLAMSPPLPSVTPAHSRNTPTLLNAAFEPTLFADSRVGSLESQVETVIASPAEMGGSVALAARRLAEDSSYVRAFARVFRSRADSAVNARSLRFALAAFVRSLNGLDSRFDRAVRGEPQALSAAERRGFTLFMGKGRCGTCHFMPLFNGTMPPEFATSEPEIIGVPARRMIAGAVLDGDPGRSGFDHEPTHDAAFKVPSLRNVTRTAPYMHNGVFTTLEQVIDFYARGGGTGIGATVPGQTLPARRIHLTQTERSELVAFLGSLTDSTATVAGSTMVAVRAR